jgi:hypothetical protein
MASISDVTLKIEPSSAPGNAQVSVEYSLHFNESEAGQHYMIGVKLFSEDRAGDQEGVHPSALLTEFMYWQPSTHPLGLSVKGPYKYITATAGTHDMSDDKDVPWSILNEDPGSTNPFPSGSPLKDFFNQYPNNDEIFAKVTLVASEQRSKVFVVGEPLPTFPHP